MRRQDPVRFHCHVATCLALATAIIALAADAVPSTAQDVAPGRYVDLVRRSGMCTSGSGPSPTGAALGIAFATRPAGTTAEEIREVAVAADGSILVGGQTAAADYPVTPGPLQTVYGGSLLASTFLGGSKQERNVDGMALDRNGDILVTPTARSRDMPTTDNAFQRPYGGGDSDRSADRARAGRWHLRRPGRLPPHTGLRMGIRNASGICNDRAEFVSDGVHRSAARRPTCIAERPVLLSWRM